jgi:general secretion pathway protein J
VLTLGEGPVPDMQRVGYRLRDKTFQRLVWPALDQPATIAPRETTLLDNVQELKVRFHATGGNWQDRWPADIGPQGMPDAVEITITIDGRGEFQRVLLVHR